MDSTRPAKRQRISTEGTVSPKLRAGDGGNGSVNLPEPLSSGFVTPPAIDPVVPAESEEKSAAPDDLLARATHVLLTEAAALANIATLYQTDRSAQDSLQRAVAAILASQHAGGKLVACGVGKSAYIAQKLTATCKSLSIRASFLHACEAVHGDLGDIREQDVLLFVSYSGRTPELLSLLPHFPDDLPILAISGAATAEDCQVLEGDGVLLPAPIPESEEQTFGVAAPTTSTTAALAVADMLALTVAEELHRSKERVSTTFTANHPGGAIGVSVREAKRKRRASRPDGLVVGGMLSPCASGSDDG